MRWFIASCLLIAACGEDPFAPMEGSWTSIDGDVTEDSCGIADEGDTDVGTTALELTDNGDGTLTVVADDELTWTCTLTDMDFDCGHQVVEERDFSEDPGLDALLTSTASVSGSFSAVDAMTGQTHVDIRCEGSDCDRIAENAGMDLPCAFTRQWSATAD